MLGKILSNQEHQVTKKVKIRDLSMRTDDVSINYIKQAEFSKIAYSSPKRRFATAWFRGNGGLFWVHIAIIGPVSEKSQSNLSLSLGHAEDVRKAISDIVKLFNKEPSC